MGDVVTALGRAVQEEGHNVMVVVPKYDCLNYKHVSEVCDWCVTGLRFVYFWVPEWEGLLSGRVCMCGWVQQLGFSS